MNKHKIEMNEIFYRQIMKYLYTLFLMAGMMACGGETTEETVTETTAAVEEEKEEAEDWDYENTNWEQISGTECRSNVQSPVNINTQEVIDAHLDNIQYNYTPFPMKIVDNGHTVQVYGTEGSSIVVEDKKFQFKQFHFHYPSEHTVDGKHFPLEMHLVHQEEETGSLAVLGVFIAEGTANPFLEKVFTTIPAQKEQEVQTDIQLMLSDYVPPVQEHYTYIGSLTTPPCTVGVDWILFQEPLQASKEQLAKFALVYANNARPVQPLNNRRVLNSAH